MATSFENVHVSSYTENEEFATENNPLRQIEVQTEQFKACIKILDGENVLQTLSVDQNSDIAKLGQRSLVITCENKTTLFKFKTVKDLKVCESRLKSMKDGSVFSKRTDAASAEQYFQFYSYLSQQQNMMQDYVRTSTYQRAMLSNTLDFQDKVVMDVGAGSGILSFFAIQSGAKKVYAVEASSMVKHCEQLVKNNRLENKIIVISGKIEEVEVPEMVDIIISEPMGYMLFNERMLESFLHAKKWLKPGGKMFPSQGDLHVAPFTDDSLYMEQFSKANFWYQPSFHGVDLSGLRENAVEEYFNQPIVDTFDMRICLARSVKYVVDFRTAHESDLHKIEIPVSYTMLQSGTVHGLAFWFDVAFLGSQSTVWLSTAPTQPLTHWYQVRCLLKSPIFLKQGQTLSGHVLLNANNRQSYDVTLELHIPGTSTKSVNVLDLKNPFFRYTGQQPQPPPGTDQTSPSDNYWNQQDPNTDQMNYTVIEQVQANSYGGATLLNGGAGDGQVILPQAGAIPTNLVPIAPVNPGSIPAATIVNPHGAGPIHLQTRTSVGGGISPNLLSQVSHLQSQLQGQQSVQSSVGLHYPISNQFMIGDYVIPGNNMVLPTQGLNLK